MRGYTIYDWLAWSVDVLDATKTEKHVTLQPGLHYLLESIQEVGENPIWFLLTSDPFTFTN